MAGPREYRFDGSEAEGPYGLPILIDCPAILIGEVRERFEVEANAVLIISGLEASVQSIPEKPLVYFQRAWHTIGEKLSDKD